MSKTRGGTRLVTTFVALGVWAAGASGARADAIQQTGALLAYDTVGSWIDSAGVSGTPNAIKYVPATGGSFLTPSSLSLGAFEAQPLAAGQSTTYTNTPFHIKFSADAVNGQANFQPNQTPIDVTGVLNGTINGPNQSNVTATFNKPTVAGAAATDPAAYTFLTGLYTNTLTIPDNPLTVVPSTTNNGMTTAQAILNNSPNTAPVPEPSTVVLFAATAAGLGFRHRLRQRSARAEG